MRFVRAISMAVALACVSALGCASSAACPAGPAAAAASHAERSDLAQLSSEQLVRRLLAVTGASQLGQQLLGELTKNFQNMPGLPAGFMERFKANAHPNDLIDLIVPIYGKHFDRTTLIAGIEFYESAPGRQMIAQLPAATKESMDVGRTWGRDLAMKTSAEMGLTPKATP